MCMAIQEVLEVANAILICASEQLQGSSYVRGTTMCPFRPNAVVAQQTLQPPRREPLSPPGDSIH